MASVDNQDPTIELDASDVRSALEQSRAAHARDPGHLGDRGREAQDATAERRSVLGLNSMRRRVLQVSCVLIAALCVMGAFVAQALPKATPADAIVLLAFAGLFCALGLAVAVRPALVNVAGNIVSSLVGVVILVRIGQLVYGPAFEIEALSIFLPVYAFMPVLYVCSVLLASVRAAMIINLVFLGAAWAIVLPQLIPVLDQPLAAQRGAMQLLFYLVFGNPLMVLMLWLTLRMREFYELGKREIALADARRRLVDQLKEANTRFDLAVSGSQDGIWDWQDVSQDVQWWSARVYGLLGAAPHTMRPSAEAFRNLVHPDDLMRFSSALREHAESNTLLQLEVRLRVAGVRSNETGYRWFAVRGQATRDANGRAQRVTGSLRDIHEHKVVDQQLQETQTQLTAVLDHAPVVIYTKDLDGRYLLVNKRWLQLTRQSSADHVIGQREADMIGLEKSQRFARQDAKVVKAGEALRFEDVFEVDGQALQFLTYKFPLRDARGNIYAVSGVSIEITEMRDAIQRFEAKASALEEANEELERFAYTVSHDLNAPLNAVAGFASLIRARQADLLDSSGLDYLRQIELGVDKMRKLIDALLELSRVTSSTERSLVDCGALVGDALRALDLSIKESGARVSVGEMPEVWCNPGQLTQVIQNLVQNGIKFVPNDRVPTIDIAAEQREQEIVLRVSDNGVGIPDKHHQRIFGVFHRLYRDTDYEGLGIGLSICERVVRAHGGRISVASTVNVGTTFTVILPRPQQELPDDEAE